MIGVIIALVSGALMSIQGVWNAQFTKQTGMWYTAMIVQLGAFLVCIGAYFVRERGLPVTSLFHVKPRYFLLGGVLGAFITVTVVHAISNLGPAKAEMIIVAAQVLTAYGIEKMGLFQMEQTSFCLRDLLGVALFVAGIVLFKWK